MNEKEIDEFCVDKVKDLLEFFSDEIIKDTKILDEKNNLGQMEVINMFRTIIVNFSIQTINHVTSVLTDDGKRNFIFNFTDDFVEMTLRRFNDN
jgi:hypothetical protein